jgi:hypothetical protein
MVAHDVRNLLNLVVLCLELLRPGDDEPDPHVSAAANRIRRYVARVNRLIGDVVDVTSIDAGKLALTRIKVTPPSWRKRRNRLRLPGSGAGRRLASRQIADESEEVGGLEGLGEVTLEPGGQRPVPVLAAAVRRHCRRGHCAAVFRGQGSHAPDEGVAALVRHLDVGEEDIGRVALDGRECLGRRSRSRDDGTLPRQ